MDNLRKSAELEAIAKKLEQSDEYRVMRAVPKAFTAMPNNGQPPAGKCIAIVDLETTGLDFEEDRIIELAIMLVFVNQDGEVVAHLGPVSWLEDPQVALEPHISLLTGLANHLLNGHRIDDGAAFGLLDRADLLVAHNASFDAAWIERRYPALAGRPWACSCRDINWLTLGYDGSGQQHLLGQHGWFGEAHRAGDDVWSLFQLLQHCQRDPGGGPIRSHLSRLIEFSEIDGVLVQAVNLPYSKKDRLKARGYRWNPDRELWAKELRLHQLGAERCWFAQRGLPAFATRPITASERHR